jgi:hypothetical protein
MGCGLVLPLLPRVERRYRYPGRHRVPDRDSVTGLTGILFVLKTGIPRGTARRRSSIGPR